MKRGDRILWAVFCLSAVAWAITCAWALPCCTEYDGCAQWEVMCIPWIRNGYGTEYLNEEEPCYHVENCPNQGDTACCNFHKVNRKVKLIAASGWPPCTQIIPTPYTCSIWTLDQENYQYRCNAQTGVCDQNP